MNTKKFSIAFLLNISNISRIKHSLYSTVELRFNHMCLEVCIFHRNSRLFATENNKIK